jgi:hypothetical protein
MNIRCAMVTRRVKKISKVGPVVLATLNVFDTLALCQPPECVI